MREAHAASRARPDAVDTTRAGFGRPHRRLRVASTFSLGLGFVPGVLAGLLAEQPGLTFRCSQTSATDAASTLLRGETEVAFTSLSPTGTDIVVEPLFTESLLLAVPAPDPLSGRAEATPAEVRDRPFIAVEPGSSSRTHMVNACARAVPRIAVEGDDLVVVESMVGAGIGVSVVPEGMDNHHHPRVVVVADQHPAPTGRTIFLACQRAGAVHESVRAMARTRGQEPSPSLHRAQ